MSSVSSVAKDEAEIRRTRSLEDPRKRRKKKTRTGTSSELTVVTKGVSSTSLPFISPRGRDKKKIAQSVDSDALPARTRKRGLSESPPMLKNAKSTADLRNMDNQISLQRNRSILSSIFRSRGSPSQSSASMSEDARMRREGAVVIQSAVRRWLVQRVQIPRAMKEGPARVASFKAVSAWHKQEQCYVEILRTVVVHYLRPLKSGKPTAPVQDIFFHMEQLYSFHSSFESRFPRWVQYWPLSMNEVCAALWQHMRSMTVVYAQFAPLLRQSEKALAQWKTKPLAKLFLHQKAKEHSKLGVPTLKKLLACPLVHLSRCPTILRELLFAMEPLVGTEAYTHIFHSTAMAQQLHETLRQNFIEQDLRAIAEELEKKIIATPGTERLDLYRPGRRFIRRGCSDWKEKFRLKIFLFSDLLILAKSKGKKLRMLECVPLAECQVKDLEHTVVNTTNWKLFCGTTRYILVDRSQTNVAQTVSEHVHPACAQAKLHEATQGVSSVLFKCIYHLDKTPFKGTLFRTVGNLTSARRILFEELANSNHWNDFSKLHRDDIATILTEHLIAISHSHKPDLTVLLEGIDIPKDGIPPSADHMEALVKGNIPRLSMHARQLLDYLTFFMERLIQACPSLTSEELSIHFLPLLFHNPEHSVPLSCGRATMAARALQLMINRRQSFFFEDAGDDCDALPESPADLFFSESFGVWWQQFRSRERRFMEHITTPAFCQRYLEAILGSKNNHDQYAFLSRMVLCQDVAAYRILREPTILQALFAALQQAEKNEYALFHLGQVLISYCGFDAATVCSYLLNDNPSANAMIIATMSSGNMAQAVQQIIQMSHSLPALFPLLRSWSVMLAEGILDQQKGDGTSQGTELYWLCNSCELLGRILQHNALLGSEEGQKLTTQLGQFLPSLLHLALHAPHAVAAEIQTILILAISEEQLTDPVDEEVAAVYDQEELGSFSEVSVEEDEEDEEKEDDDDSLVLPHLMPDDTRRERSLSSPRGYYVEEEEEPDATYKEELVALLLSNGQLITDLLMGHANGQGLPSSVGRFRFGLIQIISTVVSLGITKEDARIIQHRWLASLCELFFHHTSQSILHHMVVDVLRQVAARSDPTLLLHLIKDTPLIERMVEVKSKKKKQTPLNSGHVVLIIQLLSEHPLAMETLQNHPHWQRLQKLK